MTVPVCGACLDTLKDTRGYPCSLCVRAGRIRDYGNKYVLVPVRREPTALERYQALRRALRLLEDPDAGMETPAQELERLRREARKLEGT